MSAEERAEERAEFKLAMYARRCKALEGLLAVYRISGRPTEKLFAELEKTRFYINSNGQWIEPDTRNKP